MELVTDREESRRQTSEGDSEGGNREIVEETSRSTYVVLRDSLGNEVPLVAEERKPLYRGVLVVAAGVDDPAVKARVIEALQVLLGLPAHRITVLPR
jgi:stage III sporulation protein AG